MGAVGGQTDPAVTLEQLAQAGPGADLVLEGRGVKGIGLVGVCPAEDEGRPAALTPCNKPARPATEETITHRRPTRPPPCPRRRTPQQAAAAPPRRHPV
jgi:hypothetical protein